MYDLVVIGGGMGGLATAALAQRAGLRTALLEAHTKLGGCAGYFRRGPYTFDAGATALMGLRPGEPIGDLLGLLGVEFEGVTTSSYRVHLPDRVVDVVPDAGSFEATASAALARSGERGPAAAALLEASGGRRRQPLRRGREDSPAAGPGPGGSRPRPEDPGALWSPLRGHFGPDRPGRASPAGPEWERGLPVPDRHALAGHGSGRSRDRAVRERLGLHPGLSAGDEPAARGDAGPGGGNRPAVRRPGRRLEDGDPRRPGREGRAGRQGAI